MKPIEEILSMPDRDDAYMLLAQQYMQGPDELRNFVTGSWDFGVVWGYPDQARLACSTGEKFSCKERILASLMYEAIAAKKVIDDRDRLVSIAVIYHSCLAAGLSPEEIFQNVEQVSPTSVKLTLREFLMRNTADKSLDAFMLVARHNKDGEIEIRPSWHN